jgi:hypothetical protein
MANSPLFRFFKHGLKALVRGPSTYLYWLFPTVVHFGAIYTSPLSFRFLTSVWLLSRVKCLFTEMPKVFFSRILMDIALGTRTRVYFPPSGTRDPHSILGTEPRVLHTLSFSKRQSLAFLPRLALNSQFSWLSLLRSNMWFSSASNILSMSGSLGLLSKMTMM